MNTDLRSALKAPQGCGRLLASAFLLAALALAALGSPPSTRPDSGGLPPDSATYRIRYKGLQGYLYIDGETDRSTWQLPEQVVDSLDIRPGQRIADLGAGIGYFTPLFARAVGESGAVFPQEIQAELVEYIKERALREGTPQVHPVLGSADDAGLPDSLDLVFVCNTYRFIDNRRAYFARLREHLRADGRLAIVEFKRSAVDTTARRLPPDRAIAELERAGYELARAFDFLPKQYFLVFRVRTESPGGDG